MTSVMERTAGFLADKLDRRGMLGKAAIVGSAVVASPLGFALRPRSAYAAVCNCSGSSCACGSMCCDGYTEFCCTLSGKNTCPPGTITAGWWKVDGSQFCGGAARYYLDCNAQCGSCSCGANGVCSGACSGTTCRCANGSCANRKAGCTRFRYGQCNQHVRCVGPIVCRVVTCQPPWWFDPACGTSSRTDNATRNHNRPCNIEPTGRIDSVTDMGASLRVTGWAVSHSDYDRGGFRIFMDDRVVHHGIADRPRPDVKRAFPAFNEFCGFDVTIPAPAGKRVVCAWGVDRRSGRDAFFGMREVDVRAAFGRWDRTQRLGNGRVRLTGWAALHRSSSNAGIRVFVDDGFRHHGVTSQARPDVVRVNPSASPTAGFDVELDVGSGRRLICVHAVDRRNGSARLLDAREIDVT